MDKFFSAADGFPRASFTADGGQRIEFPIERLRWKCDLRHKVHEFLHTDGGRLEPQGRRIYGVTFDALFYDSFHRDYPKLYPYALDSLVRSFEQSKRGLLVVPSPIIGAIQARCINWEGSFVAKIRSGEAVTLGFVEDRDDDFTFEALVDLSSAAALPALNTALQIEAAALVPTPSLFDAINSAVNAVLRLRDQADLVGTVVESRLEYVADLCSKADDLFELKDPAAARILDALHDVWISAVRASNDLQGKRAPMQFYVTPRTMSAAEVAADPRVYRDAARVNEILQLNAVITDAFNIPAGVRLQFYADG